MVGQGVIHLTQRIPGSKRVISVIGTNSSDDRIAHGGRGCCTSVIWPRPPWAMRSSLELVPITEITRLEPGILWVKWMTPWPTIFGDVPYAGKPKRQPTHVDRFFSNPRMKRSGWGDWSHPESTSHGLRDFSPGASAISAMRPPFSATQEFFVSGYLSV